MRAKQTEERGWYAVKPVSRNISLVFRFELRPENSHNVRGIVREYAKYAGYTVAIFSRFFFAFTTPPRASSRRYCERFSRCSSWDTLLRMVKRSRRAHEGIESRAHARWFRVSFIFGPSRAYNGGRNPYTDLTAYRTTRGHEFFAWRLLRSFEILSRRKQRGATRRVPTTTVARIELP